MVCVGGTTSIVYTDPNTVTSYSFEASGSANSLTFQKFSTNYGIGCPIASYELITENTDGSTSFPAGIRSDSPVADATGDTYTIFLDNIDNAGDFKFKIRAIVNGASSAWYDTAEYTLAVACGAAAFVVTESSDSSAVLLIGHPD